MLPARHGAGATAVSVPVPRKAVKIIVNGEEKRLMVPMTIAALLHEMGLAERRVAVEVNREIVPRSRHGEHRLKEDDRVEVVFAIGGGGMIGGGAWR